MIGRICAAIGLIFLTCVAVPVKADELRPISIDFQEIAPGQWQLGWKQPLSSAVDQELVVPILPDNCAMLDEPVSRSANLALIGSAQVTCDGAISGKSIGLPELTGQNDALLRVAPLERPLQSHRLTASAPMVAIEAEPGRFQTAVTYFIIGAEHILLGWDHLLFVIALVLLVVRGWPVVKAATAFTVAHSITLVATTLGYTGLPSRPVEALIALSIVFLAVELASGKADSWTRARPWAVAFAFGLLHGFGFAGALRDIGLPEGEVPTALLTFNLGVEAGQLLVVAIVMALRAAVQRFAPQWDAAMVRFITYGIGIIGAYWLVDRIIG